MQVLYNQDNHSVLNIQQFFFFSGCMYNDANSGI